MKVSLSLTLAEQTLRTFFQLLTSLVVARIVAPEAFGWAALSTLLIGILTLIGQLGIEPYLISASDISDERNNRVWTLGLIVNGLLLVLSIPVFVVLKLEQNQLIVLLGAILGNFFWSLGVVSKAILNKREEYKQIALIGIFSSFTNFAIATSLSKLQDSGALALVSGQVFAILSYSLLSIWYSNLRLRWRFTRQIPSAPMRFARQLTISSFANFIARNCDTLLISISLGILSLAFYDRAYVLVFNLQIALSQVFSRVLLAKFASNQETAWNLYQRYSRIYMFASVLLFSPLIAMNHLIVSILYGDKFEQTAEILKYLAVGGFLQAMSSLSGVLLLALRATKELLKISLISASIYIIAFSLVFFRAASLIEYAIATCIASAFMALITAWKLSIMFPDLTFIIQLRQNLPYIGIIVLVFMLSF